MTHKNRQLTILAVTEIVSIDKKSVRRILHDSFNMKKVCLKWCQRFSLLSKSFLNELLCQHFENTGNLPHSFGEGKDM